MLRLVLASQSPRRRDLLKEAGFQFQVDSVKVSEIIDENLNLEDAILALARQKSDALFAAAKYLKKEGFLVLSADTVVVLGERVLGKPTDVQQATEFLTLLTDKTHRVMTAIYLCPTDGSPAVGHVETTSVTFRPLTPAEISDYVATGEPMDKAGAYAIQGQGGKFVARVEGSKSNVIGLPMEALESLLKRHGWVIDRK